MCICVFLIFLHVIKWGSIAQVSSSWTSLARRAMCLLRICVWHLCACYHSSGHAESEGIWLCP